MQPLQYPYQGVKLCLLWEVMMLRGGMMSMRS